MGLLELSIQFHPGSERETTSKYIRIVVGAFFKYNCIDFFFFLFLFTICLFIFLMNFLLVMKFDETK